jgi:hypothetical protein
VRFFRDRVVVGSLMLRRFFFTQRARLFLALGLRAATSLRAQSPQIPCGGPETAGRSLAAAGHRAGRGDAEPVERLTRNRRGDRGALRAGRPDCRGGVAALK